MPPLKRIIFVDDVLENIESMQTVAKELGLDFYGFHFQYKNDFSPSQAAAEEMELSPQ